MTEESQNSPAESLAASAGLRGRTVMLTRARAQAAEMTSQFEQFGAKVIHFPMIETIAPASWEELDGALDRLAIFDWVIFTSANGVRFFFKRLAERGLGARDLPKAIRVCAIGPGTAAALGDAGWRVDVVARDHHAEGMLAAFLEAAGGSRLDGVNVLIPRARVARDLLPEELRKLGAQVATVETYQTIRPAIDREALIELFRERRIDAVTFTSSSTVNNFAAIVGPESLPDLLDGVVVACIGPITAASAAEVGLKEIVQPKQFTAEALVEALDEAFRGSAR